jgi:regulator of sigma E protease
MSIMLNALHSLAAWAPVGIPAFLFYVTVVVFVHELGHFLVARAFGTKVEVFSIGFGAEIVGFTDKRGTRWKICWLPIGGYVKFAGDADASSRPDREAATQLTAQERAGLLSLKPVGQRAAVAAAGPFSNFLFSIILFTGILLATGQNVMAPVIGGVTKGGAGEAAGIHVGDTVTAIDGVHIRDFEQMAQLFATSGGQTLTMEISRAGKPVTLPLTPKMTRIKDGIGIVEDRMMAGLASSPGKVNHVTYNPVTAFGAAVGQTWDIIHQTLSGVGQIFTGKASVKQLSGPVGIANVVQKVAVFGFLPLLQLVAILSVSIGLVNLFPIPLLDGGHLLYYAVEAVLGRPLNERAQDVGFRLGLVLVLGLMLLVTWNDLAHLNLF